LRTRHDGRFKLADGTYVAWGVITKEMRLDSRTVRRLLDDDKVKRAWVPNVLGRGREKEVFREADLLKYIRTRGVPFDGCYPDPEGPRFNLARASKESGYSVSFLKKQIKRSLYLPEGKLPSRLERPPRRKWRSQSERTVLQGDLGRLKTAIREALESGRVKEDWLDAEGLAGRYRVRDKESRIALGSFLREAREDGLLTAEHIWWERRGRRRRVYVYLPEEVDRLRAGRSPSRPRGAASRRVASRADSTTVPRSDEASGRRPAVTLGKPDEPVSVRGQEKPPLPGPKYRIVKALLDVFPAGLRKDDLARAGNYSDPHKQIAELCEDSDWASAIYRPGRGYRGGYRILAW
jgi:hypothetical protein